MPKPSRKILASVVGVAVAVIGVGGSAQAARQDFPGGSNQGSPFTVPQDVTQVTFQATGAQGGGDSPGKGGRATATYNVVPGQKFQVTVGGVGQDYSVSNVGGGFNGGGTGGNGSPGGGGMSDVRKNDNGCAAVFPPACGTGSIIIVGGGGGGGGGSNGATATLPGGTGGDPNGGNGTGALPISGGGGGGATQVSGGAGGGAGSTGNQPSAGAAGAAFTGGAGAKASQCAGAGGGAGVFGGGGGGSSSNQCGGGGGGSSSFTLNGALTGSSGFYQRDVPPSSAAFGDVLVTYVTPTGGTTTVGSGVPSTVAFGAPVSQSVTVSSALSNGAPSGPVDFYVCGPSAGSCTSGGTLFVEKTLGQPQPGANSTATSSGGYTATQPGTYCFRAQYLGDAFYNDSFDGDDCFTVNRFDPTTAIAPSASSVNLGGSLTAKATLTGNASGGAPTGAVSFFLCTPAQVASGCPGSSGTQIGSAVNLSASGNAASADSASFTPSSGTGQYCVRFSYPGNSFYNPAANTGSAGCFTVNKGSTTAASAPGSSSIVLGAQNHDTVTVTGNAAGGSPTGTVTFFRCGSPATACTTGGTPLGAPVAVVAGGQNAASATSPDDTPTATGSYCYRAEYNGDSKYNGSVDGSSGECFAVTRAAATAASAPGAASIAIGQTNSDTVIVTGNAAGGAPTGTVSFFRCGTPATACTTGGTVVGDPVALTVRNSTSATAISVPDRPGNVGSYCYRAEYGGDSNYLGDGDGSVGECFTVVRAAVSHSSTPSSASAKVGTPVTDRLTLTGNATAGSPTGKVTFFRCGPPATDCASGGTQIGDPVDVTAGAGNTATATSDAISPSATGQVCFRSVYAGDTSYEPATDGDSSECFTVDKADASAASAPAHALIAIGQTNTDTVTITGDAANGPPTGKVTFFRCGPPATDCAAGGVQIGDPVDVTAGAGNTATASSIAITPSATGQVCFRADYAGDSRYASSSDGDAGECFSVVKADASAVSSPAHASIAIGATNTDAVTVTGDAANGSPTGTVTFFRCGPPATSCASGGTQVGDPVSLAAGSGATATASSDQDRPGDVGSYCYRAEYGGNGNYSPTSDGSAGECFAVGRAAAAHRSSPSAATVKLGASVTDTVTLTGNATAGSPTGKVTFFRCGPPAVDCTSGGSPIGTPVDVTAGAGNTATATSDAIKPSATGPICFRADYGGDSRYVSSSDGDASECFSVGTADATTVSAPAHPTIAIGQTNTDTVTVTGDASNGPPTGKITFFRCGPPATSCVSGGTQVGDPVSLTAGSGATATASSGEDRPPEVGSYCYRADYGGDASYGAAADGTSAECFTVGRTTAAHSSATTPASIKLGATTTDRLTLTGNATAGSPTGNVTFFRCGPPATDCTTGGTQVGSPVALTSGAGDTATAASDVVKPSATGQICFRAEYAGDNRYEPAADGGCVAVGKADASATSAPAHASIAIGQTNTDTATIAGDAANGPPTGKVTFFRCGPPATSCASGGTQVGNPVTVTAGSGATATASSAQDRPPAVGSYCYRAEYGGDPSYGTVTAASSAACFSVAKTTTTGSGGNGPGDGPSTPIAGPGVPVTTTITVGGTPDGGVPTGTVTFLVCGPLTAAQACTGGGAPLGAPVALDPNATGPDVRVTSPPFATTVPGIYCVAASYSGDDHYEAFVNSSATNCFTVAGPPVVSVTTPADGATYNAGQPLLADFTCAEGPFGPGLVSCAGTSALGTALDTSPGTHEFRVQAVSADQLHAEATVSYHVVVRRTIPTRCFGLVPTIVPTVGQRSITGTPRADVIIATNGADVVHGRGGDDVVCGVNGRDRLFGGAGQDRLAGGAGRDVSYGGVGDDWIRDHGSRPDVYRCGPGRDHAHHDAFDRLDSCEISY